MLIIPVIRPRLSRVRGGGGALAKLTTVEDGRQKIISDPPLIVPLEQLASHLDIDAAYRFLHSLLADHARTQPAYRRQLAERFTLTGLARMVGCAMRS
jgi:hypothetical protein